MNPSFRRFLFLALVTLSAAFPRPVLGGFNMGQPAAVILGQTGPTGNGANQGGSGPGQSTLYNPSGIWSDGTRLVVSDTLNNRVLLFNSFPVTTGTPADLVVGQSNFTSDGTGTAANQLSGPLGVWSDGTRLLIADSSNNRVLIYNSFPVTNNAPADLVIGQPNLNSNTSNYGGVSSQSLGVPIGVFIQGSQLFITDYINSRMLIYNSMPTTDFAAANVEIGQPNMTTVGNGAVGDDNLSAPNGVFSDGTRLFVGDAFNNRVLLFNSIPVTNDAQASFVYGQTGMGANSVNQGGAVGPGTMDEPLWTTWDGTNYYITDSLNNRVLIFNGLPSANDPTPVAALGQTILASGTANAGGISAATLDKPHDALYVGGDLIVSDQDNNRVLIYYPATPTATPTPTSTPTPSNTPTLTPTLSPTVSATPSPTAAYDASGLGQLVLAPVPAHRGGKVLLYFDKPPASSSWQIFNLAGQKVSQLSFQGTADHTWDTSGTSPGIYLIQLDVTYADGTTALVWRKVVIIP